MDVSAPSFPPLPDDLVDRRHVVYASGLHGDVELRLGLLLVDSGRLDAWADGLAIRLAGLRPEVVIGPAAGGAVVGQRIAASMGLPLVLAQPDLDATGDTLWRLADGLEEVVRRRAVIVDDAINAGSAVIATAGVAAAIGATVVGTAAIVVRDPAPFLRVGQKPVPLVALYSIPWRTWPPDACPVCAAGEGWPGASPA